MTTPRHHGKPTPDGQPYPPRRTLPDQLAANIRRARKDLSLSIRAAAQLVGINRGYLSRIERGQRCPGQAVTESLITALDLGQGTAAALRTEAAQTRPTRRGLSGR